MLQVKNLTIYHKKDLRPLVSGLSFTLNDGDRAAVIGEEGNGKSTLLKLLYDPILVEDYAEYHGEILKNHTGDTPTSNSWKWYSRTGNRYKNNIRPYTKK